MAPGGNGAEIVRHKIPAEVLAEFGLSRHVRAKAVCLFDESRIKYVALDYCVMRRSFEQLAVLSDAEVTEQLRGLDPLARHDALHAVKMARAKPLWLQRMRHDVRFEG